MYYYYGYFRNTDWSKDPMGQLYKVVILTDYNHNDHVHVGGELTLCDFPFTVTYEGEDTNVYKPYKCSTATVKFILEEYNPQFNNTSGNNVLVSLLKYNGEGSVDDNLNYTTEWIGFATPNVYNQGYEHQIEEFELECQDAFSTLRYYDFEKIGYNELIDNKYISFSDILKYWIKFLGTYKSIYITDTVKVPVEDFQDIFHSCYINEDNFFDEDGEPMKAIEVLEEILKYLGLTLIPWEDSIYIINYDAVINGCNGYFVLEGENFTLSQNKVYLEHIKDIVGEDIAEDGQNISVNNVYKKLTVKDDFYPIENVITDLGEYEDWVDSEHFDTLGYYTDKVHITESNEDITIIDSTIDDDHKNRVFIKYVGYDGLDVQTYWYDYNNGLLTPNWDINNDRNWTYDNTRKKVGACFIKYQTSNIAKDDVFSTTIINSVKLQDAILITNGEYGAYNYPTKNTTQYLNPQHKMISFKTKETAVGNDNYLVLKGDFNFMHYSELLPVNEGYSTNENKFDSSLAFVWAMLQTNDGLYWNGEEWTTESGYFKLPLKYEKDKKAFDEDIPIVNTISWKDNLKEEGYAVPMPHKDLPQEARLYSFQLDIARIFGVSKERITRGALLKNFDMKIATKSYMNSINSDDDSDTEYTNTINSKGVEEFEDIDFKVTTWDGKEINHSSVLYNEHFLENGYTVGIVEDDERVKRLRRLETIYNAGNGMLLRPEELKIYQITEQYKDPTLIMNFNLHNNITPWTSLTYKFFNDKIFIVDGMVIDYQYNKNTLKLVEKK